MNWLIHPAWDELSAAAASIVSFCFPPRLEPNTDGIVTVRPAETQDE